MLKKLSYKIRSLGILRRFDNFFQLLVAHAFYPKGLITYVWKGRSLIVDGRRQETAGGIHPVLILGEYNQFLDLLKADSVKQVLDLGANVGSFTVLIAERFSTLEQLVLVEGDSSVLPRLYYNAHSALPGKVDIIHGAACGKDGEVTFHQNPTSVGSGIENFAGGQGVAETVKSYSLASLIDEKFPDGLIDICKMDIEGSEYEAIASLRCGQLQKIRLLIIEMHAGEEEDLKLIDGIVRNGFVHHASGIGGNHRTHGFLNQNGH